MRDLSPFTILVVDDDDTNRLVLGRTLEKLGVTVVTAEDGPNALKKVAANKIDLVFLDIQMPGMSGFEVLRSIREMNLEMPVVAWTCSIDKSNAQFEECGFSGFLDKPLNRQTFMMALLRHLPLSNRQLDGASLEAEVLRSELAALEKDLLNFAAQFSKKLPGRIAELRLSLIHI